MYNIYNIYIYIYILIDVFVHEKYILVEYFVLNMFTN